MRGETQQGLIQRAGGFAGLDQAGVGAIAPGLLAQRLMQLPGVLGVRVKIAKLEIFDDCEVAIRVETGQW